MTHPHGKHPDMQVWQQQPFNAEPPPEALLEPVTDIASFYVRGHGPVPELDAGDHRVTVDGLVERPLELRPEALREGFPERSLTVTLQCAGNRRGEMMRVRDIEGEIPWRSQVIGTAEWTGVRLADVLEQAGVDDRATT